MTVYKRVVMVVSTAAMGDQDSPLTFLALHFKLSIDAEEAKTSSFEETEFIYTPLLDANRDRDLIDIMPVYLTEDITFARANAAKFYQRVQETLTKKVEAVDETE